MSSPSSSLSSFRDYYQHTSEECSEIANQGEFINQGLRNFVISKVFRRMECKIQRVRKWDMFFGFRCIKRERERNQRKRKARMLFWAILQKQNKRDSVIGLKVQCLHELIDNSHEERWKQLDKLMKFGLKFMKKNYRNTAICFNMLQRGLLKKKNEVVKKTKKQVDNQRYLFKLSKAVLCIISRNLIASKLFKHLHLIKVFEGYKKNQGKGQITFFKPKKDKIFQHVRQDRQIIKYSKTAKIFELLTKKYRKIIHNSFKKIQENFIQTLHQPPQPLSDSPNIMIGVIQHMIYLTGKATKQLKPQPPINNQIKQLTLKQLLRRHKKSQANTIKQTILIWRRMVNEDHIILRKSILQLQSIKKHYIEQY